MYKVYYSILLLFLVSIIYRCTSYDSNRVNTELIQGRWELVNVDRDVLDSLSIDYNKERTYLIFTKDTCWQYMPDWNDTLNFTFQIKNFDLFLYKEKEPFRKLNINLLNKDSLILAFQDNQWIYTKNE